MFSLKQYSIFLIGFASLSGLAACGQSTSLDVEEVSRLYRVDSVTNTNTSNWLFCYQQPSRDAQVVFDLRKGDELQSLPAPIPLGRSQWLYARPAHNEHAAACYVRREYMQPIQSAAIANTN